MPDLFTGRQFGIQYISKGREYVSVFPKKPDVLQEIFGIQKPIIAMIHLKPMPGSPHYRGESLDKAVDFALKDIDAYLAGGVDGLIVENGWDLPFSKPDDIGMETVAGMTYVTKAISEYSGLPIGINVLANGALASLAVAKATGAAFIRCNQWVNAYVANEGFIEGASAKALRYRSQIRGEEIRIFADVHVKHGSHAIVGDRSVAEQTRDAIFFDADVLIATGNRTGDATDVKEVHAIKDNTELNVITGSGLSDETAEEILTHADGSIVGSWLKQDGCWWNPVDPARVKRLMDVVDKLRR